MGSRFVLLLHLVQVLMDCMSQVLVAYGWHQLRIPWVFLGRRSYTKLSMLFRLAQKVRFLCLVSILLYPLLWHKVFRCFSIQAIAMVPPL
jgi:hypothetical protein